MDARKRSCMDPPLWQDGTEQIRNKVPIQSCIRLSMKGAPSGLDESALPVLIIVAASVSRTAYQGSGEPV
jgi:hypothetical protein